VDQYTWGVVVRNKKGVVNARSGQVTLFIILGIIILATVAIVLYLQYSYVDDIDTSFELSEQPVQRYIESCLIDVTEEAVLRAGQQGGQIYINEPTDAERELIDLLPFDQDYLFLANGKQQIPYWYYQKSDGYDRVAIPELEKEYSGDDSIQDQVERFIGNEFPKCLNNFESLQANGLDVSVAGETFITSRLGDASIEVTAALPVIIDEDGTISTMDKFTITVPVGLKRTYELAKEITEHELDTLFLEQNTRNLISIYGQVDSDYLPPMGAGLRFEACANREYWFYGDVKTDVSTMLSANIPYLRVDRTEFDEIEITDEMEADEEVQDLRQAMMDKFIIHPTTEEYEGISAAFNYQSNYPMELKFGNNIGYGLIQPNSLEINVLVANFCMFDYAFLYNLKYPVLVTLTDATTDINGNAFMFQFPLQVVIKNNYPRIRLNDVLNEQYNIPETASGDPTWQCDPEQRLSNPSTITVQTPSEKPVEDAVITFQCGPSYVYEYDINGSVESIVPFAKTCYMGTTDESGELTTTYPPCIGAGFVTVQHEDHVEKSAATGDIRQGSSFEETMILDQIYTMEIDMQKYFTPAPSETNDEGIGIHLDEAGEIVACNLNLEPKQLQSYETAILTLTKLDTENGIINSIPMVMFDPNADVPVTLDIAPGRYSVDILLLREERYLGEMTIEANSQAIEVTGTFDTETIYYPEDDLLIEQTFTGGAVYEWEVTDAQLASGRRILFSVFDEDMPKKVEEISAPLMHRETCSELEWNTIRPKVK
jgi:hypothetical protein